MEPCLCLHTSISLSLVPLFSLFLHKLSRPTNISFYTATAQADRTAPHGRGHPALGQAHRPHTTVAVSAQMDLQGGMVNPAGPVDLVDPVDLGNLVNLVNLVRYRVDACLRSTRLRSCRGVVRLRIHANEVPLWSTRWRMERCETTMGKDKMSINNSSNR